MNESLLLLRSRFSRTAGINAILRLLRKFCERSRSKTFFGNLAETSVRTFLLKSSVMPRKEANNSNYVKDSTEYLRFAEISKFGT